MYLGGPDYNRWWRQKHQPPCGLDCSFSHHWFSCHISHRKQFCWGFWRLKKEVSWKLWKAPIPLQLKRTLHSVTLLFLQILWLKLTRFSLLLDWIFYTYNTVIILMTVTITLKVPEEDRSWLMERFLKAKIVHVRHFAILFSRQT